MKWTICLLCLFFLFLSACTKTPETTTPIEEPKAQLQQQQPIPDPQPPTWEEQYDLGLHYLSEGNYEEAIIAFTAAIEIDPKRAPAFIGRGDTYVELARFETDLTPYDTAEKDYQTAIELDDQAVDVYIKLSKVYLAVDEPIKAVEILQQGFDATGDESIKKQIDELQIELASGTFIGVPINNMVVDVYQQKWKAYMEQYPTEDGFPGNIGIRCCGICFPTPAKVIVKDASGEMIETEISEAGLMGDLDRRQIHTEEGLSGPLVGQEVEFTGYFTYEHREELELGGDTEMPDKYIYCPNGPYAFHVEAMREIDEKKEE